MATVKLQGIYERRNAIPAAELKPGMITIWNFGYTETIKSVEPTKSGKSVRCVIVCDKSGKEYTRTMRNDRLVRSHRQAAAFTGVRFPGLSLPGATGKI